MVRAFGADGVEVGVLKAQGAWGEIARDLKLRQDIVRLRGRKRLASELSSAVHLPKAGEGQAGPARGEQHGSDICVRLPLRRRRSR